MKKINVAVALASLTACGVSPTSSSDTSTKSVEATILAGKYTFSTSTTSGKCIDISGAGTADGTNIQQWTCNGGVAQSFRVEDLGGGLVRFVNPNSDKCMDISGAGTADGTNIQLWTCNGSVAQAFRLEDAGGGRVAIRNPNSNKCVDVNAVGRADGTNIQLWTCYGNDAQAFTPQLQGQPTTTGIDLTFYVVSDTHADPQLQYDLLAMARALNSVGRGGTWPTAINGHATGFDGSPIAEPRFVVFTGDLLGWGTTPTELQTFRHYFEAGASNESINYPSYVGLGNHDVDDADRPPDLAAQYRNQIWNYVDSRHRGGPVPVTSFDNGSHAYSWDVAGVHFVQLHRFPGDSGYGLPSSLGFLSSDLAAHAADGRPVFLFHHYAMDSFGMQDRWWTAADRSAYRNTINGYGVSGIFAGHSHAAFNYSWDGERVFQVNNAKAENGTGNNDGNGSFAVVRVTDKTLTVVTCRWLDDAGHYELIEPFFSGPTQGN